MKITACLFLFLSAISIRGLAQEHDHSESEAKPTPTPTPHFHSPTATPTPHVHTPTGEKDTGATRQMASTVSIGDPMNREGSGTSWLPDSSPMHAYTKMYEDGGMLMLMGTAFVRYTQIESDNPHSRRVVAGGEKWPLERRRRKRN